MLIYCQWRTTQFCHQSADVQYSVLLQSWAPAGILARGGKVYSFPCLFILLLPSLPSPSLLLSPLCPLFSAVERIALIQLGVCGSNLRIFWTMNVSCGNDFGTFCAKQNVVTELILYIFQGGQVPLLPMPAGVRDYNTKVNVQNCWSHVVSFTKVGRTVYQLSDVSDNRLLLSSFLRDIYVLIADVSYDLRLTSSEFTLDIVCYIISD